MLARPYPEAGRAGLVALGAPSELLVTLDTLAFRAGTNLPAVGITLDLSRPATELTAALVDVRSVSGEEVELADAVERALRACPGLVVQRIGNVVLARTELDLDRRVVLAGHLDTVPVADNLPSRLADGRLHGCGSSDM